MKKKKLNRHNAAAVMRCHFTLIELLIVIAIIAILAGMCLPALSTAKGVGLKTQCVNNTKVIAQGTFTYAGSYQDEIPDTVYWGSLVASDMVGKTFPSATNQGPAFFRCPTSKSAKIPLFGGQHYGINHLMISGRQASLSNYPAIRLFPRKISTCNHPSTLIFIGCTSRACHEDGTYAGDSALASYEIWHGWDLPGAWHQNSGPIAFLDVHVELKKRSEICSQLKAYDNTNPTGLPTPGRNNLLGRLWGSFDWNMKTHDHFRNN